MTDDSATELGNMMAQTGSWGAEVPMESGQTLHNELGGLRLWVTMLNMEWQVRTERYERVGEDTVWHQGVNYVVPGQEKTLQRFIRDETETSIRFRPALANLPVVIRPYNPLHIPGEHTTTIYLSTVVWMQLIVGEDRMLMELPVMEPSWTWLGRSTMEGELCYAAQTYARLNDGALPRRPWRASSAVTIHNHGKAPLVVERLSLPTPVLPVFQQEAPGDWLWTPGVRIECEKNLASASLSLDNGPPAAAGACLQANEPRQTPGKGHWVKAIDRIFG